MIIDVSLYVMNAINTAVGPGVIIGVSIGVPTDKATWRIDFSPAATPAQKTAAQAALQAIDYQSYVTSEQARQSGITNNLGRQALLDKMRNATDADIDAWVDANVTTLPGAKIVLKAIIKILSSLV